MAEYETFVEDNGTEFGNKWVVKNGFNWWAFIFGSLFFLRHRMWKVGVPLLIWQAYAASVMTNMWSLFLFREQFDALLLLSAVALISLTINGFLASKASAWLSDVWVKRGYKYVGELEESKKTID